MNTSLHRQASRRRRTGHDPSGAGEHPPCQSCLGSGDKDVHEGATGHNPYAGTLVLGLSSRNTKVVWDTSQSSPRACIVVRKDINYFCLSEYMTRDLVPIQMTMETSGVNREVVIASAYFAGDGSHVPPAEVRGLVKHCTRRNIPLIVGCDANAHNEMWGSSDTNERGEYLLEYLLKENLEVFNVGDVPTFVTRAREEVLDLTFGSARVRSSVKKWRVSSEPSMSDHRIIRFDIEGLEEERAPTRNPRRTDWLAYVNELKYNLERVDVGRVARHHMELETAVEQVSRAIRETYEASCPLRAVFKEKDVP